MSPCCDGTPAVANSLPVVITANRGIGRAVNRSLPVAANAIMPCGSIRLPPLNTLCPARKSSPGCRMWRPICAGFRNRMPAISPFSDCTVSTCSTGTIASQLGGTGAPVMISTALPEMARSAGASPAATIPTTGSSSGAVSVAPTVSATRSAKPSMAEFANVGTARRLVTSLVVAQRPRDRSSRSDPSSGVTAPAMISRASR